MDYTVPNWHRSPEPVILLKECSLSRKRRLEEPPFCDISYEELSHRVSDPLS